MYKSIRPEQSIIFKVCRRKNSQQMKPKINYIKKYMEEDVHSDYKKNNFVHMYSITKVLQSCKDRLILRSRQRHDFAFDHFAEGTAL